MALRTLNFSDPLMKALKAVNSIGGKTLTEEEDSPRVLALEELSSTCALEELKSFASEEPGVSVEESTSSTEVSRDKKSALEELESSPQAESATTMETETATSAA